MFYNKKTLKGVSKVVVNSDIKQFNYVKALQTNEMVKKQVASS